jgi:hypothetical protein
MTTSLTVEELQAITDLILFHEDWNELEEILEVNVTAVYDKVCDLQSEITQ